MGLDGRGLEVREDLVGETGRYEVLGLVRRVARVVVVAAAIRRDFHRGQRLGTIPQVNDGHGHIAPVDALLDHQALAVGEGIHHRAAQALRVLRGRNTERRTTIRRLDDDREGHRALESGEHV